MTTAPSRQEGSMRVWAVTFKEYGGSESVEFERHGDKFRPLMFADTPLGYGAAVQAFVLLVEDRIGRANAMYEYGQFGVDAKVEITVRDHRQMCDDAEEHGCTYDGDTIRLVAYEVREP